MEEVATGIVGDTRREGARRSRCFDFIIVVTVRFSQMLAKSAQKL